MPSGPPPPRELERQIFEFAAQIDMATKLRLVLVARRVRIWIEPFVYETVAIDNCSCGGPSLPSPFESMSGREKPTYIRNLLLGGSVEAKQAHEILQQCPNVNNLALWCATEGEVFDVLLALPLRRLSANFQTLMRERKKLVTISKGASNTPSSPPTTRAEVISMFRLNPETQGPWISLLLQHYTGIACVPTSQGAHLDSGGAGDAHSSRGVAPAQRNDQDGHALHQPGLGNVAPIRFPSKMVDDLNFDRYILFPFQQLTHLELTNFVTEWDHVVEITLLPTLTHLAFNYDIPGLILARTLKECRQLRILVSLTFHYSAKQMYETPGSVEYTGVWDHRLVYLSQPAKSVVVDWVREAKEEEVGRQGTNVGEDELGKAKAEGEGEGEGEGEERGVNFWKFAEELVGRRRP